MTKKPKGMLIKKKVVIDDEKTASSIYNRGKFGVLENKKLILSLIEALYLMEKNKIEIIDFKKKPLTTKSFIRRATRIEPRFYIRYLVYKDIRSRGYITKTAFKYGADFRVYDRGGEPGKTHAPWILFAVSEAESFDWRKFAAMNRVAHSVRKKLLIGIVDDEGDITYYEIHWKKP